MRPRGRQFHLNILFILVSYFWEGRANAGNLEDGNSDNVDEQIQGRLVSCRIGSFNRAMDKCTNFYAHACGRASDSEYPLPCVLDKEVWYSTLEERFEALMNVRVSHHDKPAIRKVKMQYQLCMDRDERESRSFKKLKSLIQANSNFPMILPKNSWDTRKLQVIEPQKYDQSLFAIHVRDNNITIDHQGVSVYGRFLSNLKNVSAISHPLMYKLKIKQILEHMGLLEEVTARDFEEDLDAVMRFRRDLHSIARFKEPVYYSIPLGDLDIRTSISMRIWPEFRWLPFLRDVFINATGVNINEKTLISIELDYIQALRDLMRSYGPACVANHIKLHLLESYLLETSATLIGLGHELAVAAHDPITVKSRRSHLNPCLHQPHMLRALNYMYLKKWFPKKSRAAARRMIRGIKDSLYENMQVTDALSRNVTERLRDHIESVTVILGSEEKYIEYDLIHPLYGYEVPEDHLSSVMNARRFLKEYEYSKLNHSNITSLRKVDILEDKPYVSAEKGVIDLPIGYLHRSNLSPTLRRELSYATLGYKISLFLNEVIIKQGFPLRKLSKGIQWYGGNLTDFKRRTACIENQCDSQFHEGRLITDEESEEEEYDEITEQSVYSNAAFQIVYHAFASKLDQRRRLNKNQPAIEYMEQEFVYNWATMYCMPDNLDESKLSMWTVNNVLRNSKLLHSSFNCRKETPMSPRDKCVFWGPRLFY